MFNESSSGNLIRCLENCKRWADDIIIYDDKSTDDSVDLAKQYTQHVILGEKNEWARETFHKQTMLDYIHSMDEKPDWILWLDCDEIVDRNCIENLTKFCEKNQENNIDAFSFRQINLWRGEKYYRKDGPLYGENPRGAGWFIRLWMYHENLKMNEIQGMDQILYPITIKRIEPCDFKIIHYGFSNYKQLMKHIGVHSANKQKLVDTGSGAIYVKLAKEGAKWAEAYVKNGKGVPNMFINEENLIVEKVPLEWFPKENIPINVYLKPNPFPISELKVYSDIKENILFLGNCQIKVITRFCSHYINKKIEYLNIVYDLKDKSPRVDHLIKNADIIVTQPFTSGRWYYDHKKINELRNNNSYLLVVHCLYYDGYFPYMNIDNYKDKEQNDKLKNEIIKNSETSFKNLYERENGINNYIKIDIPIYNFIKENYKNKRLFLRKITQQIF